MAAGCGDWQGGFEQKPQSQDGLAGYRGGYAASVRTAECVGGNGLAAIWSGAPNAEPATNGLPADPAPTDVVHLQASR